MLRLVRRGAEGAGEQVSRTVPWLLLSGVGAETGRAGSSLTGGDEIVFQVWLTPQPSWLGACSALLPLLLRDTVPASSCAAF
jgi:hypothetical protein